MENFMENQDGEFGERRELMVADLMAQGILRTDAIIRAFMQVPRHVFAGSENENVAYADYPRIKGSRYTRNYRPRPQRCSTLSLRTRRRQSRSYIRTRKALIIHACGFSYSFRRNRPG